MSYVRYNCAAAAGSPPRRLAGVHDLDVPGYLARLRIADPGRPSIAALTALHQAHVERVPYETLAIQLATPTSIDPFESAWRIVAGGRGGYCYHLNGAFSLLLQALGYEVRWHVAGAHPVGAVGGADGHHLALTVHGLVSPQSPGGMWLVDVGLGDALHSPLPLRPITVSDGPFSFVVEPSPAEPLGWRLHHHPQGSFGFVDLRADPAGPADFQARHEFLSTSPASPFVQTFTAQRRDATGVDLLRGRVLRRLPEAGAAVAQRELATEAQWRGALAEIFGLVLDDRESAALWPKVTAQHEAWQASR